MEIWLILLCLSLPLLRFWWKLQVDQWKLDASRWLNRWLIRALVLLLTLLSLLGLYVVFGPSPL